MNDLLLRTLRGERVERPPVWMMRQAGRYLPEYRAVRAGHDFLTMVRTPELAVEVTLQPVDIVGVDAAIIFSDILVIPEAMGLHLEIEEGSGPGLSPAVATPADIERLSVPDAGKDLGYVLDALALARRQLDGRVPLIGFAGGPWTLAAYMIEGQGSKSFSRARRFLVQHREAAHELLSRLSESIAGFLEAQAEAGAQVIQVFESWAGTLGPADLSEFSIPYLARIVERVRSSTGVPVIVFPLGAGQALREIAERVKPDCIGIDWHTDPDRARTELAEYGVAVQGNLDPAWLYASPADIRDRTHRMLDAFDGVPHVANLGHGIFPDTPVDSARAFVEAVKEWRGSCLQVV